MPQHIKIIFLVNFCFLFFSSSILWAEYNKKEIIIKTKSAIASPMSVKNFSIKDPILKKYNVSKIISLEFSLESRKKSKEEKLAIKELKKNFDNIYKLIFTDDVDIKKIILEFGQNKEVVFAQPNFIYRTCGTPNDPYYNKQWNLPLIKAPNAWDVTYGSANIVIAVIDTGVDWQHEDLANNIWINSGEIPNDGIDNDGNGYIDDVRGWDFVSVGTLTGINGNAIQEDYAPRDNNPMDAQGHGTKVSGIISAEINNALGIVGVAPKCSIMAIRAGYITEDDNGAFNTDDVVLALKYAADNGAKIVNLSWGGAAEENFLDVLLEQAIKYVQAREVVIVAAAGNESKNIDSVKFLPAIFEGVIAVSAVDKNNNFAVDYSNFGESIDIAAPGTDILSTYFSSTHMGYNTDNGTSFAVPHVAGVLGLVYSYNNAVASTNAINAILLSATDKGLAGKDIYYGYGLINAHKALGYVDPTPPTILHQQIASANKGETVLVTANVTDNFSYEGIPSVTLNYAIFGPNITSLSWQTQKMVTENNIFKATIPAQGVDIGDIYYYFTISDLNPNNTFNFPGNTQTTSHHIFLDDLIGPIITSSILNNDYVSTAGSIGFSLYDNTSVSANTIECGIVNSLGQVTLNITSTGISYSNNLLTIRFADLNLQSGYVTINIFCKDIYNNDSKPYQLKMLLTNSNNKLALSGTKAANSILNYPNPFNPNKEKTKISYMISVDARVTIYIYSLNLQLVKQIESNDLAGYYEVEWDGKDLENDIVPPGVYIMAIKANTGKETVIKRSKIAVIY